MWLMLCCTSSFSSPASVHQRKHWHLAHLLHSIYIKYSPTNDANLRFFSPATAHSSNCPRRTWPSGEEIWFFFFLVWTERKTGKPMFLKQCSSLDQKQETGIVLIKFCSLKGSHFFYFRQMYILLFFSSCSTLFVDACTIYLRWRSIGPPVRTEVQDKSKFYKLARSLKVYCWSICSFFSEDCWLRSWASGFWPGLQPGCQRSRNESVSVIKHLSLGGHVAKNITAVKFKRWSQRRTCPDVIAHLVKLRKDGCNMQGKPNK